MKNNKNYGSDETLKHSNKIFVIFIIVFIRILIFDHIFVTSTSDQTTLYSMRDTKTRLLAQRCRDAVRLPHFWPDRPAVCFALAEAQFEMAYITRQHTKNNYVLSQLNQQQAAKVDDIITSQPEQEPFERLNAVLVRRYSTSRNQRVRQSNHMRKWASWTSGAWLQASSKPEA